jgi:hypothetical protein
LLGQAYALIGEPSTKSTGKRGPEPKIQLQYELIETMPEVKQSVIAQLIDLMLQSSV